MIRQQALVTALAAALALAGPGCSLFQPTAPTPSASAGTTTPTRVAASSLPATGGPIDDPTALKNGKAAPIGPAPGPLSAPELASGTATGQEIASALNADQDLTVYGQAFDQGNGIVGQGGGNLLSEGGLGFRLLADETATGTAGATATVDPAASTTVTPPTAVEDPGATVASLPTKYHPALVALASAQVVNQLSANVTLLSNRLSAHRKRLGELAVLQQEVAANAWTKNPDKTISKTVIINLTRTTNGKSATHHVVQTATVEPTTGLLVQHVAHVDVTFPGGGSRTIDRELVLLENGGQYVELKQKAVGPKGAIRITSWITTIALDGSISGKGSVVVTNAHGKVTTSLTLTLDGTVDAPHVRAADDTTKLVSNLNVAADGAIAATIQDATGSSGTASLGADEVPADDDTP